MTTIGNLFDENNVTYKIKNLHADMMLVTHIQYLSQRMNKCSKFRVQDSQLTSYHDVIIRIGCPRLSQIRF